jgi:hypothetical protein
MRLFLIVFFSVFCAIPQLSAQGNGIEQASELVTVGPDKFLRWYGHADRTYFIQVSDPNDHLNRWTWAPIIESGNDEDISYEVDGTADKGFFRLKYTDQPTTDPDNDDFDGDTISNLDEVSYYNSDPLDSDTDNDGMPDGYEVTYYYDLNFDEGGYDYDGDGLTNLGEYNAGTEPYYSDTDGDGMKDGFEVTYSLDPLSAADATNDEDSDGLNNLWEFKLGLNPLLTDSNNNGISDPLEDRDQDSLTNISELSTHLTLPDQPDTDDDGLSDGWEILYGYFALVNNETDADLTNDPDDDPDSDGLLNSAEDQIGTNPNNADTDGDGFSDPVEDQSASSATNPASTPTNPGGTPGGPVIPPPPTIPVQVNFGDHSGSHSEKYRVWLEPLEGDANTQKRYRTNRKYGQTQTETFHLPAGAKYKITLTHIGTNPNYNGDPKPDYDYTLVFTSNSTDTAIKAIPEDPAAMLGVHWESEDFFADGKDATLYIAWMTSETVVSMPQDRKRKKLGVGEEVNLMLKPSSLPSPTWALTGTQGTSQLNPLAGITSMLTAGERACTPSTEATILGELVKIDFEVVEPSAMVMERYPGTGIRHTNGTASAGFQARAYIMPHDVSFTKIEVREGTCLATATGFIAAIPGKNGEVHANGAWIGVQQGTALRPSLWSAIDTISTGDYLPPFAAGGTFNWPIPWLFKVSGGNEKQFTIATHNESVTGTGATTISKGGVSVTTQSNDPTSTY